MGYAKRGKPRKYQSPDDMQEVVDKYFDDCDENEKPYLISGLCLALGFAHRSALIDYDGYSKDFHNIITRARQRCQAYAEAKCYEKHSQGAQFILNAGHSWSTNAQVQETRDVEISLGEAERELLAAAGSKLIESRVLASVPVVQPVKVIEGETTEDSAQNTIKALNKEDKE